jgi:hypothetical protein
MQNITIPPVAHSSRPPTSLRSDNLPEFLRVQEAVTWSRLGKGTMYGLMERGLIRSISLRERGKIKGTRLIVADSLKDYLFSHSSAPVPSREIAA